MLPLVDIFPPLMRISFVVLLLLLLFCAKEFASVLAGVRKREWGVLGLIFLLGVVIRAFIIPHSHTVYYDEYEHVNIAQNIAHADKFFECMAGTRESCQAGQLQPWPPAYHTLLGLVFQVFGDSEEVAYNVNAIIGGLTLPAIFILFFLRSGHAPHALIGTFLFSLIPVHLKFSGSTAPCIISIFLIVLCLVSLELFLRRKTFSLFLLFLAALFCALHARPENFLMIPVCFFYVLALAERPGIFFGRPRVLVLLLVFLVLLVPLAELIYYGSHLFKASGWSDPLLARLWRLPGHALANLFYFFSFSFVSPFYIVLAALGGRRLMGEKPRLFFLYLFFFAVFFFFYSSYHVGGMTSWGASRYSLVLFIPLLFMGMEGWDSFWRWLMARRHKGIIGAMIAGSLLFPAVLSFRFSGEQDDQYRFILSMKERLSDNADIIATCPSTLIATIHKRSISHQVFLSGYSEAARGERRFILFKDLMWRKRNQESGPLMGRIEKYYAVVPLEEREKFGFYDLVPNQ